MAGGAFAQLLTVGGVAAAWAYDAERGRVPAGALAGGGTFDDGGRERACAYDVVRQCADLQVGSAGRGAACATCAQEPGGACPAFAGAKAGLLEVLLEGLLVCLPHAPTCGWLAVVRGWAPETARGCDARRLLLLVPEREPLLLSLCFISVPAALA